MEKQQRLNLYLFSIIRIYSNTQHIPVQYIFKLDLVETVQKGDSLTTPALVFVCGRARKLSDRVTKVSQDKNKTKHLLNIKHNK